MTIAPALAVIIPAYNRSELLRYSLASVRAAAHDIPIEVIVVDDGSEERLDHVVGEFSALPVRLLRQPNSGSIPARLNGLRATTARYVQFLDSDDMVAPEKFQRQIAELERTGADIVYSDGATAMLEGAYENVKSTPSQPFRTATSLAEFCFRVQPNPHAPIYRRNLLEAGLNLPVVSAARHYDPVGDAWIYYNICTLSGKVLHTPGPWAIVGRHPGVRYTRHWEVLGVAAWHMMVEFHRRCPKTPQTEQARRLFGETCFATWRALPRNFNRELEESLVDMWRCSPPTPRLHLGGRWFGATARLIGLERAARVFRMRRPCYAQIATVTADHLVNLIHIQPKPESSNKQAPTTLA